MKQPTTNCMQYSKYFSNNTNWSHSLDFLLKKEYPPQCTACDYRLTVKHILFDGVTVIKSRNRHLYVNSFKGLFVIIVIKIV